MEDGEVAVDNVISQENITKDVDSTIKDEKCVADENAQEDSDKEDGELDEESETDHEQKSEESLTQQNGQNNENAVIKETALPVTENPDTSIPKEDIETDDQKTVSSATVNPPTIDADIANISLDRAVKNTEDSIAEDKDMDGEEGELDDSLDEDALSKTDNIEQKPISPNQQKDLSSARMDFDEPRQEEEQLDYGEDELEEKIKVADPKVSETKKSDGEADSDSEGEIKSDAGEDFEEGETRDHPLDIPPEQKKICRFYEMGNCTWGDRCRYLHPGVNDKGNYDMFCDEPPKQSEVHSHPAFHPPHQSDPFWEEPPPFIPPPAAETAWEKGLRHAKEMKKRALQRKVQEPDFLQKREVISTIGALNEDRDMEFVNITPLANKGYDPFKEEESGEYATPTPEEVRRHLMRDRRPPHRHIAEKDHRHLPPPNHMMHSDSRRERRPPSPRRDRYPPEGRGLSPRRDIDRRHGNFPPNELGFPPNFNDRRDRQDFPGGANPIPGLHPFDGIRREPALERVKDDRRISDGPNKGVQNGGPTSGPGQSWNDPWARGRPPMKGRGKAKSVSSSSSDSSSGSSSRSSSSGSSRSSYSRSSKSSSSGSDSSSYSSRDSSGSPSPTKGVKKKVLATAKQRNAAPGAVKKNLPPPKGLVNAKPIAPIQSDVSVTAISKPPVPVKKPPLARNPLVHNETVNILAPPKKVVQKKKAKRQSSSSSEFSHSSDSSPSPSRAKGKSGSDSDSGSSSGSSSSSASSSSSSSSSDSEGDKPANRRKRKPVGPATMTSQLPHAVAPHPMVPQQNQPPPNKGKVMVPSKPGRKDIKMTIIDKPGMPKKRTAADMNAHGKKSSSRRNELLEQLKAVEDAIARKRAKLN